MIDSGGRSFMRKIPIKIFVVTSNPRTLAFSKTMKNDIKIDRAMKLKSVEFSLTFIFQILNNLLFQCNDLKRSCQG